MEIKVSHPLPPAHSVTSTLASASRSSKSCTFLWTVLFAPPDWGWWFRLWLHSPHQTIRWAFQLNPLNISKRGGDQGLLFKCSKCTRTGGTNFRVSHWLHLIHFALLGPPFSAKSYSNSSASTPMEGCWKKLTTHSSTDQHGPTSMMHRSHPSHLQLPQIPWSTQHSYLCHFSHSSVLTVIHGYTLSHEKVPCFDIQTYANEKVAHQLLSSWPLPLCRSPCPFCWLNNRSRVIDDEHIVVGQFCLHVRRQLFPGRTADLINETHRPSLQSGETRRPWVGNILENDLPFVLVMLMTVTQQWNGKSYLRKEVQLQMKARQSRCKSVSGCR